MTPDRWRSNGRLEEQPYSGKHQPQGWACQIVPATRIWWLWNFLSLQVADHERADLSVVEESSSIRNALTSASRTSTRTSLRAPSRFGVETIGYLPEARYREDMVRNNRDSNTTISSSRIRGPNAGAQMNARRHGRLSRR